ncbi:MAG: hypothetical protein R6X06_10115 [Gammaproteobacteria bacterium]
MAKFRAIIEGQNVLLMMDNEPQQLDFHRTVCLEAECVDSATSAALETVMGELSRQQVVLDCHTGKSTIRLEYIEQVDVLETACSEQGFVWYFADDALFDYTLRRQH